MIHHLLYISEASQALSDVELGIILEHSRTNNLSKDLTGILIKNGNFFIQLLEGKKEVVENLYRIIVKDSRHTKVKTLIVFDSSERLFPQWSMGLVNEKAHVQTMSELIPLIHQDVMKLQTSKDRIISVLRKFNQA